MTRPGIEPTTSRSQSGRSNHYAINRIVTDTAKAATAVPSTRPLHVDFGAKIYVWVLTEIKKKDQNYVLHNSSIFVAYQTLGDLDIINNNDNNRLYFKKVTHLVWKYMYYT